MQRSYHGQDPRQGSVFLKWACDEFAAQNPDAPPGVVNDFIGQTIQAEMTRREENSKRYRELTRLSLLRSEWLEGETKLLKEHNRRMSELVKNLSRKSTRYEIACEQYWILDLARMSPHDVIWEEITKIAQQTLRSMEKRAQPQPQPQPPSAVLSEPTPDRSCIVCCKRSANAALIPCGHLVFCKACSPVSSPPIKFTNGNRSAAVEQGFGGKMNPGLRMQGVLFVGGL